MNKLFASFRDVFFCEINTVLGETEKVEVTFSLIFFFAADKVKIYKLHNEWSDNLINLSTHLVRFK